MANNSRMRLEKLEARLPPPAARGRSDEQAKETRTKLREIVEGIKQETARVEALPPAAKIIHYHNEIAEKVAKAAMPAQPRFIGSYDWGTSFHQCLVQDVKGGFPDWHYVIRGCEIAILREAGYDVSRLVADHQDFKALPWQWRTDSHPLPADARQIIEEALFKEQRP